MPKGFEVGQLNAWQRSLEKAEKREPPREQPKEEQPKEGGDASENNNDRQPSSEE
jgi:hypothetical protein